MWTKIRFLGLCLVMILLSIFCVQDTISASENSGTVLEEIIEYSYDGKIASDEVVELDIKLNEEQDVWNITLLNYVDNNVDEIQVAIWSANNSQDDLCWYSTKQVGESTWNVCCDIRNHGRDTGIYYFHVYKVWNNVKTFITSEKAEVEGIVSSDSITVDNDIENGAFLVNIGELYSPADIKCVDVAVWSSNNGQDDLVWYSGKIDQERKWYVEVDCKNHYYDIGTYVVHVYVRDYRDIYQYISGVKTEITYDFEDIIINAAVDGDQSSVVLNLDNVKGTFDGKFEVAVWSDKKGQDDLRWYTFGNKGNGWSTKYEIKNHKNDTGVYYAHVYYKSSKGNSYVTGIKTEIEDIHADELVVTEYDAMKGTIRYELFGLHTPGNIETVKIAVWSERKGQDDLVWYEMCLEEENVWQVTVPLIRHNYELGIYFGHVYVTDNRGVLNCVKTISYKTEVNLEINAEVNNLQNRIDVSMDSEKIVAGIRSIRFAIWSDENGQDDLKWYTFDDKCIRTIYISNHKYSVGKYVIHMYATMYDNSEVYVGGTTFDVERISCESVKETNIDSINGVFGVSVEGVTSPAEIKKLRFAVWTSANGQDDLIFYEVEAEEEIWNIQVDTYNHNYESGNYCVHVYAEDYRGIQNYIGGVNIDFTQDTSGVVLNVLNNPKNNEIYSELINDKVGKDVVDVQLAVWSKVNGQDDLRWYSTQKEDSNKWTYTISTYNHKWNSGIYYIHAYGVLKNGTKYCIKTTELKVLNSWEPEVVTKDIKIENLSKKYNFLFVADTHVIVVEDSDESTVSDLGNSRKKYFVNKYVMSSEEQFPYWICYANEHQVDGLLMGGDIIDYPSESNLNYLKENLEFLNVPYIYCMGNHDSVYPWEQSSQEYRSLFDEMMNGNPSAHYVEYEEFVILTVDNSTYQILPQALPVIENAFSLEKPIILMMHIPLQTDSLLKKASIWSEPVLIGPDSQKPNEVTQRFVDKILAEDSLVQAILAGHVHVEDTSKVNDKITQYVVDMSAKGKGILLHLSN